MSDYLDFYCECCKALLGQLAFTVLGDMMSLLNLFSGARFERKW